MTTDTGWLLTALALVLGAAAGGWLGLRLGSSRSKTRLRRTIEELQQKHAAASDQLRAAQVRAQTELEQVRSSFKRQLASVADEPRAAAARAEERLRAAYDELDRLRRGGPSDTAPSDLGDGFAATRPMREGM